MSKSNKSFLQMTKDAVVDNKPIGNKNFKIFTKHPIHFALNYSERDNLFYLSLDRGYLPYKWQWEELKDAIDEFYQAVDHKDIVFSNEKQKERVKESMNQGTSTQNKVEKKQPGYVYLLAGNKCYKIGKSKAPLSRRKTLTVKLPFEVELIHKIKTDAYGKLEKFLHGKFSDKKINGEWFDLDDKDIEYIKSLNGGEYNEQR